MINPIKATVSIHSNKLMIRPVTKKDNQKDLLTLFHSQLGTFGTTKIEEINFDRFRTPLVESQATVLKTYLESVKCEKVLISPQNIPQDFSFLFRLVQLYKPECTHLSLCKFEAQALGEEEIDELFSGVENLKKLECLDLVRFSTNGQTDLIQSAFLELFKSNKTKSLKQIKLESVALHSAWTLSKKLPLPGFRKLTYLHLEESFSDRSTIIRLHEAFRTNLLNHIKRFSLGVTFGEETERNILRHFVFSLLKKDCVNEEISIYIRKSGNEDRTTLIHLFFFIQLNSLRCRRSRLEVQLPALHNGNLFAQLGMFAGQNGPAGDANDMSSELSKCASILGKINLDWTVTRGLKSISVWHRS
eukprot:snap_masked-scaffold_8-processed-gene-8.53-mRNA-1 protein AED:1.00 eAED:1.00 QI:0/-1/0/0/-1/1/1/0/359